MDTHTHTHVHAHAHARMYTHTHTHTYENVWIYMPMRVRIKFKYVYALFGISEKIDTGWRRCMECLVFLFGFPKKSPINSGSFAERDLQLGVSYAFPRKRAIPVHFSEKDLVPKKSPIFGGSFAERNLQPGASYAFSPPCIASSTAYCMWSVIQSQSRISISWVSSQWNLAKETQRMRSTIVVWEWRNDTPTATGYISCMYMFFFPSFCLSFVVCRIHGIYLSIHR